MNISSTNDDEVENAKYLVNLFKFIKTILFPLAKLSMIIPEKILV